MKNILRAARENKGIKTRELSKMVQVDQALISKFESGSRRPTKDQLLKLASTLDIELNPLLISWLKEKILHEISNEEFALEALKEAQEELTIKLAKESKSINDLFENDLQLIEELKIVAHQLGVANNIKLQDNFIISYVFESNSLDGNSISKIETELILNEGQSIVGKSMHEHLAVINHQEALRYTHKIAQSKELLTVATIIEIHQLLFRGINPKEAGTFRTTAISIKDDLFSPPKPESIEADLESLMLWLNENKNHLHPVLLAAAFKIKFVCLQSFKQGTAKIARLLTNLILLHNDLTPIIYKSDSDSKKTYLIALMASIQDQNNSSFTTFLLQQEKESLNYNISFVKKVDQKN